MLLHNQLSLTVGTQSAEPANQQLMELLLANTNRRVRDNEIEAHVGVRVVGSKHRDIETEAGSVCGTELAGSGIDVDGKHLGMRCSGRDGAGNRSITTSDVQDGFDIVGGLGRFDQ